MPGTKPADQNNQPVGTYLRQIREARGLELDEAARITRISKSYLAAIEDNLYDKLPSPAYLKGSLRSYAGFLGLSGDEVLNRYEKGINPNRLQEAGATEQPVRKRFLGANSELVGRKRWMVPLLLLFLVVISSFLLEDRETKKKEPLVPVLPQSVVPAVPVLMPRTSATQSTKAVSTPPLESEVEKTAASSSEQHATGIILRLKVIQDGWLHITIDDNISQQYDLKAGDLIEWKGERFFTLEIGNAGGIEGEFNGKPLPPFGESGKTAHVVLKAEGVDEGR